MATWWQTANKNIKSLDLTPPQLAHITGQTETFVNNCLDEKESWTLQDIEHISQATRTTTTQLLSNTQPKKGK